MVKSVKISEKLLDGADRVLYKEPGFGLRRTVLTDRSPDNCKDI
jgi:hypothetical protein